jgi:hypothetical protein
MMEYVLGVGLEPNPHTRSYSYILMTRSGDYPPLIVTLPKVIADAIKVKKGDRLDLY